MEHRGLADECRNEVTCEMMPPCEMSVLCPPLCDASHLCDASKVSHLKNLLSSVQHEFRGRLGEVKHEPGSMHVSLQGATLMLHWGSMRGHGRPWEAMGGHERP